MYSYARELDSCYWNSVRKGVALGILIGWLYFTTYLIYALAFISGVLLIPTEERRKSMISDILVVSYLFSKDHMYLLLFRLLFPLVNVFLLLVLLVLIYKRMQKLEQQRHQYLN